MHLVHDISAHISAITVAHGARSTRWGKVSSKPQPYGVALIVTNSTNPIRFGLAPLASAIAAGNTVILCSPEKRNSTFFSVLEELIDDYMDTSAIHLISDCSIDGLSAKEVDRLTVFGTVI